MKKFKFPALILLAMATLTLSSCLHILEEVTVKSNGSGSYSMTLDMSEMKGMMDMMKGMVPDSLSTDSLGGGGAVAEDSNPMSQMGAELTNVAKSLEGVKGLTNIHEINDTSAFKFGYSFDFENVEALNKALQIVAKEKFDSKNPETFQLEKKKFTRLSSGNFGEEIKKQLSEGEEGGEEQMEMVKMFFTDMTYKQVYHFEKKVKNSSNKLSEVSEDGQTVTIVIKPFDEEQAKLSPTVATEIKLK